ncbi:hypothetical protein AGMMS49975_26960 [Clostridia bacterium]|nr:hypothetical protein AGMMS49975_26960 [Clostridia bacterium]
MTLGVLLVIAFAAIILSTAIDLVYMVIPGFRGFVNISMSEAKQRVFISKDAISAAEEEEALRGRNIFIAYIRHRIKTYLVAVMIGALLVSGEWKVIWHFIAGLIELTATAL